MSVKRVCGYLFIFLYVAAAVMAVAAEFVNPQVWINSWSNICSAINTHTRLNLPLPNVLPNTTANTPEPIEIELLFVGDVMAHMPQVESAHLYDDLYDFAPHFALIAPLFHAADYVVANLETTLSPRPPYSGYPAFATPDKLAYDLAESGVDFVTLANNHIADRGTEGVLHTIAALDNAGIDHAGAAVEEYHQGSIKPRVVEIKGVNIALLCYTYGVNGSVPDDAQVAIIERTRVAADIARLPKNVDLVVALLHWGNEYQRTPSTQQLLTTEWMRSLGVDLIVGSHPHVVQPYTSWTAEDGTCIGGVYYSLGNFISNQNDRHTDYGLAARVKVRKEPHKKPSLTLHADTLYRQRYNLDGHQYFRISTTRY